MSPKKFVLALFVLMLPTFVNAQVILRIEGDDGLKGLPMSLDGTFVGVVGDTIIVSGAAHQLSVEVLPGIRAMQEITLREGVVTMRPVRASECAGTTEWRLGNWRVPLLELRGDVTIARLATPTPTLVGPCVDGLPNYQCFVAWSSVEVTAVPEVEAEIRLDGRPIGAATSTVVRLQHCEGAVRTIDVVLRKEGYANCTTGIRLGSGANKVSCILQKLGWP